MCVMLLTVPPLLLIGQATRLSDDVEELGVSTTHKVSQVATLLETIITLQADILGNQ